MGSTKYYDGGNYGNRSAREDCRLAWGQDRDQHTRAFSGTDATVVITIEDNETIEQPHVIDILKTLPGHRLYQSAEEVDAYIREERDAWEA